MTQNEKIIDKVQKLLALAQSSNEHEAKLASEKAQTLMLKHNLDLAAVEDREFVVDENTVSDDLPFLKPHLKYVAGLVTEYHVKSLVRKVVSGYTVDGRRKFRYSVTLVGEPHNVKMATFVYNFLAELFPRLWLEYKRANGLEEYKRESFYHGLACGLDTSIKKSQNRFKESYGLVPVIDPRVAESLGRTKTRKATNRSHFDPATYADGVTKGEQTSIRAGITTKHNSTAAPLALGAA